MVTIIADTTEILTLELKNLIANKVRVQAIPFHLKQGDTEYKPRQPKIDSLINTKPELYEIFRYFSFTQSFSYTSLKIDTWYKIFKVSFPFSDNQIQRMSKETIDAIKTHGIKGIMYSFHAFRHNFFSKTEMIESDYEENRLKYFIQNQKEPTHVYTNSEYNFIKLHMEDMMTKAVDLYFSRERESYSPDAFQKLLKRFYFKMLEKFDTLHESVIELLTNVLFENITNERLTEADINAYFSYKIPLLTKRISYMLESEATEEKKTFSTEAMIRLFDLCIDKPVTVSRLLTKEAANQIFEYMIYFAKLDEQTISTIVYENNVQHLLKNVNNLLNNISPFIEIVEQTFMNPNNRN